MAYDENICIRTLISMCGMRLRYWELGFQPKLGFCQIDDELVFLRWISGHLTWFDLKMELIVALNCELGELPYVLKILDFESSGLG